MKSKINTLLLVLLAAVTVQAKEIVPGPTIWYSISEKILKESWQLIVTDAAEAKSYTKKKAATVKVLKVSTKFQQKNELIIPDFITLPIAKNGWLLQE